ncbi:unnamed protein product, partial [Rotaria socialis]
MPVREEPWLSMAPPNSSQLHRQQISFNKQIQFNPNGHK